MKIKFNPDLDFQVALPCRGARLIDREIGRPVNLRRGSYTFQMAGTRHAFSWRLPGRPRG